MVNSRKRLPPYVSYRTFRNFLDGLQDGVPSRIDRSYWGDKWSGSNGTQVMAALRFLGLVDGDGVPTNQLKLLVAARGAAKGEVLKQVGHSSYDFLVNTSFDASKASYAQLEEAFHDEYQVSGDVVRKCVKFFIGFANEAGISLSPFIMKKSGIVRNGGGTKRNIRKKHVRTNRNFQIPEKAEEIPESPSWDKMLLTKFPAFDPAWPDEVKLKWFSAFDELLKRWASKGL